MSTASHIYYRAIYPSGLFWCDVPSFWAISHIKVYFCLYMMKLNGTYPVVLKTLKIHKKKKKSSFKNICKNHVLLTTRRKKRIQQRQISFCCLPIKRSARLANMKAQLTGGLYNVKILPCCQLCERLIISGWILPPDTVGGYGLIDRKMKLINVWGEMSTCLQLTSLKCWTAGVFN